MHRMLTKEYISKIKAQGNGAMTHLIDSIDNEKNILFVLNNLGRLPEDFDEYWIKKLLSSKNDKIRLSAVKNIGKTKNVSNLEILYQIASNDSSTTIRREAVSSIGRMRHEGSIIFLFNLLNDNDPKIVSQAIRGLLIFKGKNKIDEKNSIIKYFIFFL